MEDRQQIGQGQMRVGHARFVIVVAAIGVLIAIVVPDIAGLEGREIAKAAVQRQQVRARIDAEGLQQPDIGLKTAFVDDLKTQRLAWSAPASASSKSPPASRISWPA